MKKKMMVSFDLILRKIGHKTIAKDLMFVTLAVVINNLVSFIIQIAAAHLLGPQDFGTLSLAISIAFLTGTIGELGLGVASIRLFNKYQSDCEVQQALLSSVLILKASIFVILISISLPLGKILSRSFSIEGFDHVLFAVAFITGGLLLFWNYLQTLFQCYRDFNKLAIYLLFYSGLRVFLLPVVYIALGGEPITWLLVIYTIPTAILFGGGLILRSDNSAIFPMAPLQAIIASLKEILLYGRWVALSTIAYTSMPYVVRIILAAYATVEDVGIFSAGMTFTMVFITLNTAIRSVLFPRVTSFEGQDRMRMYLTRLRKIAPCYFAVAIVVIIGLALLQWLILGYAYRAAMPIFMITACVFACTVFLGLGTMLLHTMMVPQIDSWVNVVRLGFMLVMAFVLIPSFHALGAAIAYVVPILAGEVWMFRYVYKKSSGCI